MIEARLNNLIREKSVTLTERYFKGTKIPSWGWRIETIEHTDNECTFPWLTWGHTQSGNPVEVKVPLKTVTISQKHYRFYGFRLTKSDYLQAKLLKELDEGSTFEISLLKSKINKLLEKGLTVSIDVFKGEVYFYLETQTRDKGLDAVLIRFSEKIKFFIEQL